MVVIFIIKSSLWTHCTLLFQREISTQLFTAFTFQFLIDFIEFFAYNTKKKDILVLYILYISIDWRLLSFLFGGSVNIHRTATIRYYVSMTNKMSNIR